MVDFSKAIAAAAEAAPTDIYDRPTVPGLVLHMDGDYMAYYCAGNDESSPGEAKLKTMELLDTFKSVTGADKIVVHNTARGCDKGERFIVATVKPYQGQRDSGRKPKNHGYIQRLLMDYEGPKFRSKTWATREADDGIGACSHFDLTNKAGYAAIGTADKDMRMLPGLHVDWTKLCLTKVEPGDYAVVGPNGKLYGLKWFCMQMLMGDQADNCPGLEYAFIPTVAGKQPRMTKVGEKTAEKILAGTGSVDDGIACTIDVYRGGYRGRCSIASTDFADDRWVEQAALMWMRTDPAGSLTDFATHSGVSRINSVFDQPMWDAVERLSKRVAKTKAALAELTM